MAGKLQNEDHKTLAELTGAGGSASQLLNDTKIYVTATGINKQLSQAIIDGDIGGGDVASVNGQTGVVVLDSGDIAYSGTNSNIAATTAQDAIDEVVDRASLNYIKNGSATVGVSGWATYADAAGSAPVDGTGGTPNVTWTRSTTTPLRNEASFLFTKDAVNRQGQGVSYQFTIAEADKCSTASVRFNYKPFSGTYADGDLAIYVVDVTSGQVIQPTAFRVLNATVPSNHQAAEFQLNTNTSYRLCIHVASTSASAYSVQFDSISLTPNTFSVGAAIGDWTTFTPTGTWTTNTTYTGRWRRVGSNVEVQVRIALSGAPTATSLFVNLPSGLSVDTSNILSTVSGDGNFGYVYAKPSAGNAKVLGKISYGTTTSVVLFGQNGTGNIAAATEYFSITQAAPFTFANGDLIYANFSVPVSGWGASQVLSSETANSVIASTYYCSSNKSSNNTTPIDFDTRVLDTNGAVTTGSGWRYTVQVPGNYSVSVFLFLSTATGSGGTFNLYKNGSAYSSIGFASNQTYGPGTVIIPLVAGDYLDVRYATGTTVSAAGGSLSGGVSYISIQRLSGPAQVAASESVVASYNTSVSATSDTSNPVQWSNRIKDTHLAWNGSRFTAPVSGIYSVSQVFYTNGATSVQLYKNGSAYAYYPVTSTSESGGTVLVPLLAGEFCDVRCVTSRTVSASSLNSINIVRVGNY